MKKAIVTGADGFIGRYLVKELCSHGVKVFAMVKDETIDTSAIKDIDGVEIVYCELDNISNLKDIIGESADVFFHLAWAGSTGAARADYNLQLTNVKWTLDAANAAKACGCRRFVGAGTLAELDVNAYIPLKGSTPNAVSCYGSAKLAAHYLSKAECNRLEIEHIWARLSNTYGIGNYTSNFVNFACKLMLTGVPADFTPGEQLYDFVNAADIAQGLYCMGLKGVNNTCYYIGSTRPRKLKEFIKIMRDTIDPEITLNLGAVAFNGIIQPDSAFDCSDLVNDTGYCPRISFEEGIADTVEWIKKQIEENKL